MKTRLTQLLFVAALAFPVSLQAARPYQPETDPEATPAATTQTGPSGIITTVAGNGYLGYFGNGGPATEAQLTSANSVVADSAGDFYIADTWGQVVLKVKASTGIISVYAGTGFGGYSGDNGPATAANLNQPSYLALDSSGNLYISDSRNNVVREVNAKTGKITTVAGNGAGAKAPGWEDNCGALSLGVKATTTALCQPQALATDSEGNLYIGDDNRVLKVTASTGILSGYAGNGNFGYSGDGGLAINSEMSGAVGGLALDRTGNLYIADTDNCAIRKVTASTGVITSMVGTVNSSGNAVCNYGSDPGDGEAASISSILYPGGIALDGSGDLFVADQNHDSIRVIDASNGNIYTVAGSYYSETYGATTLWYGYWGYSGDGGPATAAYLSNPEGIALDPSANLYFADVSNSVIRKVTQATVLPNDTPVISPGSGVFSTPTTVTITSPVEGATIYYTTNGATPTTSSAKYSEALIVKKSETVEAFATLPGGARNTAAALASYIYQSAPAVTTEAATNLTASGATLNGTVNANNATTQYWFAYGTSASALSKTTAKTGALTGTKATAVNATLTGLTANTTYYFQLQASNAEGTTPGKVLSFKTK